MIKSLTQQGMFTQVSNGSPGSTYYQTGQPMSGQVRYCNNEFEVYDGSIWHKIQGSYASVGLTSTAESAINWALGKMNEENKLQKLSNEHPAVKIAYENMKRAAEQLEITQILSKEEYESTS